jgi:hypothetical protein
MDRNEAKKILALYRPGVMDDPDPRLTEALDQLQRDPELAAWFDQHCAVFQAIRAKLKEIPVPEDLRRKIVADDVTANRILPLTGRILAVAALAAMVLVTAIIWVKFAPRSEFTFNGYRDRMARKVQRAYFMEMMSKDQMGIRDYFHRKGAPSDYVLPKNLQKLPGEGGAVFTWNNHQVSLLCLDGASGGGKNDLYLFMANRAVLPGSPFPDGKPVFKPVNQLMTMTWTVGDRVYLLAGAGDEKTLAKYLE